MWPSFSLWACRILKMRSCLRSPLAPGKSKVLAILVSSVMFFSLSSAMVMIHLNPCTHVFVSVRGRFLKGGLHREDNTRQEGGAVYAARRCASAKFSGSDKTACRSEPAIRDKTSFIVSGILVLGRWNFRVALEAS